MQTVTAQIAAEALRMNPAWRMAVADHREHLLEKLSTALDAFNRSGEARDESRLFDAALDCGMSYDEPSVETWAAERVTRWLEAA